MKKVTLLLTLISLFALGTQSTFAQSESTPYASQYSVPASFGTLGIWDLIFSFNTANGGEQGIGTDGQFYYTTKWNTAANAYMNKYDPSGNKVDSFMVGSACPGIRDLAFDGQFFYGGQNLSTLYKMDVNAHTSSTIPTGVAAIRHCAFDPAANSGAGGFWTGAWNTMALISKTGTVLSTVSGYSLSGTYGSAYDNITPGGPYLWLADQNGSGTTPMPQYIHQFSIANQALTGISHDLSDVPDYVLGDIVGGLESSSTLFPGKFVLVGNMQETNVTNKVFVYEMLITDVATHEIHTVVKVYPNPAKDYIFVTSSIFPIQKLSVINQLGQVVYENNSEIIETRIPTNDFEAGVYYIRIQTKDQITTEKVTVQ